MVEVLVENEKGKTSDSRTGTKGMTCEVTQDDGSSQPFQLKLPSGETAWYCEHWGAWGADPSPDLAWLLPLPLLSSALELSSSSAQEGRPRAAGHL